MGYNGFKVRVRDPQLLNRLREHGCFICGAPYPDIDHIQSRGAGGDDRPDNLLPLCRAHHQERHRSGLKTFVSRYKLPIDTTGIYPKLNFQWS